MGEELAKLLGDASHIEAHYTFEKSIERTERYLAGVRAELDGQAVRRGALLAANRELQNTTVVMWRRSKRKLYSYRLRWWKPMDN